MEGGGYILILFAVKLLLILVQSWHRRLAVLNKLLATSVIERITFAACNIVCVSTVRHLVDDGSSGVVVGRVEQAAACTGTYLLFRPNDATMLYNRDYYQLQAGSSPADFTPRQVTSIIMQSVWWHSDLQSVLCWLSWWRSKVISAAVLNWQWQWYQSLMMCSWTLVAGRTNGRTAISWNKVK